ncbi:type VI secretion system Vgr family protein [Tenacibaculum mesophilum]|uniref:type VI secretion system Vgr family protein n=1 Tax=Tenacibaculum mesophilum TaxID=104268 RepID=UPI00248F4D65|nr:phage baseplate assembly protein V [Tenacibaculum mesophilum]
MKKFDTKISIDGQFIDYYESISLAQQIYNHHFFCVELDYQVIEKLGTHTIDASKKWLGKDMMIVFEDYSFSGVITNIELVHNNGFESRLHVSGYSKTILLEAGKHLQSWLKKELSTIIKDVTEQASVKAEVTPVFKEEIEYECQYNESHYTLIKRLAKQYNEWLYYDGQKLLFGKPSSQKAAIELIYGKDLPSLHIGIETKPNNFSAFSYNSLLDEKHSEKVKGNVKGLNELGAHSFKASKDVFKLASNQHLNGVFNDKSKIEKAIEALRSSKMANSHVIKGKSNKQSLTVGSIIKVLATGFKDGEGAKEQKPYGEYIITEIEHEAFKDGYENSFTAIASSVEVLSTNFEVNFPIAEPQLATVVSNKDPENKGRVQVKFQWQVDNMKSSWIPVLTPDGGKSDQVNVNRGFVFVPEEGDQVMIGFRYNTPNRPFVMGSFFNGKTGAGGSDNNKIKSITTRSGSTITFDDDEGKGKITVSDPSGSTVTLNGDETISISAPKSITLSSEEIKIEASKSVTIDGKDEVSVNSKKIVQEGSDLVEIKTKSNLKIESKTQETKSSKYSVEGKSVDIQGMNTSVKGNVKLSLN